MLLMRHRNLLVGCLIVAAPAAYAVAAPTDDAGRESSVHTAWRIYTTRDGLPHNGIRAVHVFGEQVWVGTDGGLALYEAGVWKSWTRSRDGLPAQIVSAIEVDPRTRDVWLGTWGDGLVRLSAGRFDLFDQINSGLAGNLVFDVTILGNRVWAATNGGISSFDPFSDSWSLYFARRSGVSPIAVTTLTFDGIDLIAGAWHGGVRRFDEGRDEWLSIAIPPGPGTARAGRRQRSLDTTVGIALGGKALWRATQTNVSRRDAAGGWGELNIQDHARHDNFVYCVASPNDSQVWLGTHAGLEILADWLSRTWVTYPNVGRDVATGETSEPQPSLSTDPRGLKPTARRMRRPAPTLPGNRIRCITFDRDGVWVGTDNGLARGTGLAQWEELSRRAGDNQSTEGNTAKSETQNRPAGFSPRGSASSRRGPQPATRQGKSVAIAVLGPQNRTIALPGRRPKIARLEGRADLLAVQLAVANANRQDGHGGQPTKSGETRRFDLVTGGEGYARYGWGTPEDEFTGFASYGNVAGLLGFLDPKNAMADAVAVRTEVPIVNLAAKPDDKSPAGGNPWVFWCWGDEPRKHRMLMDYIIDQLGHTRIAALHTPGQGARRHLRWLSDHARSRGHTLVGEVRYPSAAEELDQALKRLQRMQPDVVLTYCDAFTSAVILRRMRRMEMSQLFVGGPSIVSDVFVKLVGTDPGPAIALTNCGADLPSGTNLSVGHMTGSKACPTPSPGEVLSRFAKEYAERNMIKSVKTVPGLQGYRSFEAADHLLTAVRIAGADRDSLRRTLQTMHDSALGELHYERLYSAPAVTVARLVVGRWVFQEIADSD